MQIAFDLKLTFADPARAFAAVFGFVPVSGLDRDHVENIEVVISSLKEEWPDKAMLLNSRRSYIRSRTVAYLVGGTGGLLKWVHDRDEMFRVAVAAVIGTVLAWVTYEIVFWINWVEPRATTSWVVAFIIGIFRQHHLHRVISFPGCGVRYATSLKRLAIASVGVLLASAALNYVLVEILLFNHRMAWVICLVCVAGADYASMKFFVFNRHRQAKRAGKEEQIVDRPMTGGSDASAK